MKWNHLPMAGGLYDQSPELLDRFYYIMGERAKWESQKTKQREKEQATSRPKNSSRGSAGRRR